MVSTTPALEVKLQRRLFAWARVQLEVPDGSKAQQAMALPSGVATPMFTSKGF